MNYMEELADQGVINEVSSSSLENMNTAIVSENTYVQGEVEIDRNQDLIVSDDSILFIDGQF